MEPKITEAINEIPNIDTSMRHLIDVATHLFKDEKLNPRELRLIDFPAKKTKSQPVFIIVIKNSLSLWFTKTRNGWKYDGWEMGDYSSSWTEKTDDCPHSDCAKVKYRECIVHGESTHSEQN